MATVKLKDLKIKKWSNIPKDAIIRFLDKPRDDFFFFPDYSDLAPRKPEKNDFLAEVFNEMKLFSCRFDFEIKRTGDGESDWEVKASPELGKLDINLSEMSITSVEDEQGDLFDDVIKKANEPQYALLFRDARTSFFNDVHRENALGADMFSFRQMYSLGQAEAVEDPIETMLLAPSRVGVESFRRICERIDA